MIPMLRPDGRIVGGRSTTIYDFPFQVSYNNYGAHRGGGVILSPTKVLTAGHVIRGTMLRLGILENFLQKGVSCFLCIQNK